MVLRRLIAAGVLIGLLASLIANQLFGISASDPATFIAVAAVLFASGLIACFLPARRAAKVDLMLALRHE